MSLYKETILIENFRNYNKRHVIILRILQIVQISRFIISC